MKNILHQHPFIILDYTLLCLLTTAAVPTKIAEVNAIAEINKLFLSLVLGDEGFDTTIALYICTLSPLASSRVSTN